MATLEQQAVGAIADRAGGPFGQFNSRIVRRRDPRHIDVGHGRIRAESDQAASASQ